MVLKVVLRLLSIVPGSLFGLPQMALCHSPDEAISSIGEVGLNYTPQHMAN